MYITLNRILIINFQFQTTLEIKNGQLVISISLILVFNLRQYWLSQEISLKQANGDKKTFESQLRRLVTIKF